MPLTPWHDPSPFITRTTIRAPAMNVKLAGIAQSFAEITAKINGHIIQLPDNFNGNTEIPTQPYLNTIPYINQEGHADLLKVAELTQLADTEVTVAPLSAKTHSVTAADHAVMYVCDWLKPVDEPDNRVIVTVGRGIRVIEGQTVVAKGSVIFLVNNSDAELWVVPDDSEGVTVLTPGTLRAFGKGSSVALVCLSETLWLLAGDIYPADGVVD